MKEFISNINHIICGLNGALTIRSHEVSEEIQEIYDAAKKLEYSNYHDDKENIKSDFKSVYKDVRKAKSEYDLSHG